LLPMGWSDLVLSKRPKAQRRLAERCGSLLAPHEVELAVPAQATDPRLLVVPATTLFVVGMLVGSAGGTSFVAIVGVLAGAVGAICVGMALRRPRAVVVLADRTVIILRRTIGRGIPTGVLAEGSASTVRNLVERDWPHVEVLGTRLWTPYATELERATRP